MLTQLPLFDDIPPIEWLGVSKPENEWKKLGFKRDKSTEWIPASIDPRGVKYWDYMQVDPIPDVTPEIERCRNEYERFIMDKYSPLRQYKPPTPPHRTLKLYRRK